MKISLLAAASTNNVIGKDNKLLWNLPNDMRFFKNMTWGMPVIMGRKTFESFNGDPLPGRFNFVVSRQPDWRPQNEKAKKTSSLDEAVKLAGETDCRESFIIGGGQIYQEAIKSLADKIYLTRVHVLVEGDAFFPTIDQEDWMLISNADFPADSKHAYSYSFQVWIRK